ncbi:MAG TPA: teicoplanin resistance protein VanZ [Candidatus Paceibacterota bacterium]|jgi:hypothetical protein|nr:teicoplanin resistance protein VanZ [Candidatus Paceibacterota bacterium]HRZ29296.1 teicoplanin resistance protein VanZ [Candidatus Paceibacterota bacterium]
MRYQLWSKASGRGCVFSLEAGMDDGVRNFDHHGQYSKNPSPCNDGRIQKASDLNAAVEITHIDADTFVGILRLAGKSLPNIDLTLLEQIDLKGSSVCPIKTNPTLCYSVGITALARKLNFPRVSAEQWQDVTAIVEEMISVPDTEIIEMGREAQTKSENSYFHCRKAVDGKVGFWAIGAQDPLDPSRPYEDGVKIVVVYRNHYKTVSIYCDPKSQYAFAGKIVAGIEFAGHPKACSTPRGVEFSEDDALQVFKEISKSL